MFEHCKLITAVGFPIALWALLIPKVVVLPKVAVIEISGFKRALATIVSSLDSVVSLDGGVDHWYTKRGQRTGT